MAEIPLGPSALPASSADSIPFPGCTSAVPGEGEEQGWGRGTGGQLQHVNEEKGTRKAHHNHHCCHPSAPSCSSEAKQQQLNGLITNTESARDSHPHPASYRGTLHGCEGPVDGEVNHVKSTGGQGEEHNHSHPNSSLKGVLTMTRSQAGAGEEHNGRTDPHPNNHDSHAGDHVGVGDEAACSQGVTDRTELHQPYSDHISLITTGRAGPDAPVSQMEALDLNSQPEGKADDTPIQYVRYESELQMPDIMRLITKDLSEPYSIYTYRYFIHNWPQLCFLAMVKQECVGAIVCKLDMHKKMFRRGYIAMLAVDSKYRCRGIGTSLVKKAIYAMVEGDCDEVVLETEITNKSALKLYENLGFVRDKRLFRYYLNGVDALRLKLWLR